jgi:hypothetical protein
MKCDRCIKKKSRNPRDAEYFCSAVRIEIDQVTLNVLDHPVLEKLCKLHRHHSKISGTDSNPNITGIKEISEEEYTVLRVMSQ